MARSIANFLVGIGLDTTDWDKGARKVDTNLSSFRSKAGIAGGVLAAAFAGASLAAIRAGNDADKFMRKVSNMDTSAKFIYSLSSAFSRLGGDADDAYQAISKAEDVLDQLRKGDASALEAASLAQLNIQSLQGAANGEDFLYRLSDILAQPGVENWQKRTLQKEFGLSNEALQGMEKGSAHLRTLVDEAAKYAGNLEGAAQAGREYAAAMSKINSQISFIAQALSKEILPKFTAILEGLSGFIDRNIDRVPKIAEYAAENTGNIAAAGIGATIASAGGLASGIGRKFGIRALTAVGTGATYGGAAGAAYGLGSMLYDLKASDIKDMTGYDVSPYYRAPSETVAAIGDWWRGDSKPSTLSQELRSSATTPTQAAPRPNLSQQARSDASVPTPIVIDNRITLDGREMARWKKEQDALLNYATIDEISSTVAR